MHGTDGKGRGTQQSEFGGVAITGRNAGLSGRLDVGGLPAANKSADKSADKSAARLAEGPSPCVARRVAF